MGDKVYKKIDVVGCSAKSIEDAIESAVVKASESLHGLSWFELKECARHQGRQAERVAGDPPARLQARLEPAASLNATTMTIVTAAIRPRANGSPTPS